MPRQPPFSEDEARVAIARSVCWSDALRLLGYVPRGHNYRTLRRWAERWQIPVDHFDPHAGRRRAGRTQLIPLEQVLVQHSNYARDRLKRRLFDEGLKERQCELCGQGEVWNGLRMSLVLDHINGVSDDNRLQNLRMVCANCAATLDTHCGRNTPRERVCPCCGNSFTPRNVRHRYCSLSCVGSVNGDRLRGTEDHARRKVPRPSYAQLLDDLQEMSFVAIGRKYGVSDKAVRKWVGWYDRQRETDQPSAELDEPYSQPRRARPS